MRKKIRRSIEEMPRPAYIFLKYLLALVLTMLSVSMLLFTLGTTRSQQHLAVLLLESPAGVLLLGLFGLALLLDRC